MTESTMNQTQYCGQADVVNRILMKGSDVTTYAPDITYAIVEASRMVDTFLLPYVTTLPFVVTGGGYNIPDQIVIASADLAASVFKRRYTPNEVKVRGPLQPDMINDVDGTGWFALGLKKLLEYIKDNYALKSVQADTTGKSYNIEVYKDLFARGLITLKEARAYMANANSAIQEVLNTIHTRTLTDVLTQTSTLTKTATETVTKTYTDVMTMYHTKQQKSFGFVSGYFNQNQGGYILDSAPNEV